MKNVKKNNIISRFAVFYKPHLKLFTVDMICAFVVSVCNLIYPQMARDIINIYAPNKQVDKIVIFCSIMLGIFIVKTILGHIVTYWGHVVGVRIQSDMRMKLFKHLQKLPFSYYDETKVGNIMSRIINDLFEISELAHHGPEDVFLSVITIIGALIIICTINFYLALIVFLIIPIALFFVTKSRLNMKHVMTVSREKTAVINSSVESAVSGIRVSKSYTAEQYEIEKFAKSNQEYVNARTEHFKVIADFHTTSSLFIDLLYLITLFAGGIFFCFDFISAGDMTAYILYISILISPIRTFVTMFEEIEMGMSGFRRYEEIMDVKPEYDVQSKVNAIKLEGNICFNNVSFRYDKDVELGDEKRERVLENLNLTISKGETIALVGPSGCGKTTICNLIPRFYEIESGNITIDGIDICDISSYDLRKNIGIVQQEVFLYGGTIKENIAYGNLNASDEMIIEASKLANIHDFIMTLPNKYDTYIGERGVKLSGGQKQRVSIARAFLKNPPILILDEATSALDNVTEMQIQESLEKLSKGRTTIVVAHRLSTIKNADEILVVTKNGVEERGTHKQLLEKNGIYADLYKYQYRLSD